MAVTNTNIVALTGNLVRDPEEIAGGKGVRFSIACNESWYNKDSGERDEYVNYFDCITWGKAADPIKRFCSKGSKVAVVARAKQERWEKDGQKNSRVTFHTTSVEFLTTKSERAAAPDAGTPSGDYGGGSSVPDDDDIPF